VGTPIKNPHSREDFFIGGTSLFPLLTLALLAVIPSMEEINSEYLLEEKRRVVSPFLSTQYPSKMADPNGI